jgi:hypothetical protein
MFLCFQESNSHFWCHREKLQLFFASGTQSGTPSSTQSGTPSCTKTVGDLKIMVLVSSDGRMRDMGFDHACGLQLLNS